MASRAAVAAAPDSRHAIAALQDGTRLLQPREGQLLRTLAGHEGSCSRSGDRARTVVDALSGSYDCTLKLWEPAVAASSFALSMATVTA